MSSTEIAKFLDDRKVLNEIVMKYASSKIKKFYSLDHQVYQEGALSRKTKELIGFIASLVLRCDDCIKYHLVQCHDAQVSNEELEEALSVGLVVGGSITIPHLRYALSLWDKMKQ